MRNLLVAVLLLAAPVLAGCMEKSDGVVSDSTGDNVTDKDVLGNATGKLKDTLGGAGNGSASNETHLPHVHDYWDGRDRILLADEAVELNPWMTFNWVFGRREPAVGGAWWELPQGKTIYQGTGKLEVTLTWTDATISSLALAYRHAGTNEWSEFTPATSGTPIAIDITPEMTDLPHSGGSRWTFLLKAANAPGPAVGNVKLKAEILRVGDLHAFPAHKDFFANAESLVIMDAETESKSSSWTSNIVGFAQGNDGMDEGFTLPEGSIVPPGTEALIVDIRIKDIPANEVYFSYRDASGRWDQGEPIESPEPGVFRFVIPVEGDGVDSYYATVSSWRFFAYAAGGSGSNGLPFSCGGCTDQTLKLHAKIEAFDESPFEEGEGDEGSAPARRLGVLGL